MELDAKPSVRPQFCLLKFTTIDSLERDACAADRLASKGIILGPQAQGRITQWRQQEDFRRGRLMLVASDKKKPEKPREPAPSQPEGRAPPKSPHEGDDAENGRAPVSDTRKRFVSLLCTLFQEFECEACKTSRENE